MSNPRTSPRKPVVVAAVSGGPDSAYLMWKLSSGKEARVVVGHVNYRTRGTDSEKDRELVEEIAKSFGYDTEILVLDRVGRERHGRRAPDSGRDFPPGFEKKARDTRYRFLRDLADRLGAESIAVAHTADDQVETILMRIFEGAGIGGLKGIPREGDGIVRPLLDLWKEDILFSLKKRKIPYRLDRSNLDARFERNWVRNVLLPLLEARYGKAVKKRIFTVGERFRELDGYLEVEAGKWIRRNVKRSDGIVFRRTTYSALPSVLRVKILQRICFDRLEVAPNERLLKAMDGNISNGGPSARVNVGEGWELKNRYEEALFAPGKPGRNRKSGSTILLASPGEHKVSFGHPWRIAALLWKAVGKRTSAQAKRIAAKGDAELFDAAVLDLPLAVRPLRAGDRIRPFGGGGGGNATCGEKKVKEILIDRKIPADDRWGRPVLCDAKGAILWIPGILRSALAPVNPGSRESALFRIVPAK